MHFRIGAWHCVWIAVACLHEADGWLLSRGFGVMVGVRLPLFQYFDLFLISFARRTSEVRGKSKEAVFLRAVAAFCLPPCLGLLARGVQWACVAADSSPPALAAAGPQQPAGCPGAAPCCAGGAQRSHLSRVGDQVSYPWPACREVGGESLLAAAWPPPPLWLQLLIAGHLGDVSRVLSSVFIFHVLNSTTDCLRLYLTKKCGFRLH